MYLHVLLAVDEAQDVVARNGVTAFREDVHADGALGDDAGLLLVKALSGRDELGQVLARVICFLLALPVEERHVFAPSRGGAGLLFLVERLSVLVAEHHGLFAECDEEILVGINLMELAEPVKQLGCKLKVVVFQPLAEGGLAGLLQLAVLTPQDGLYVRACLGREHKVDPRRLHML